MIRMLLAFLCGSAFAGAVGGGMVLALPPVTITQPSCPLSADGEEHVSTSVFNNGTVYCDYGRTKATVPKTRAGTLVKVRK